jgi:hypothetical protein
MASTLNASSCVPWQIWLESIHMSDFESSEDVTVHLCVCGHLEDYEGKVKEGADCLVLCNRVPAFSLQLEDLLQPVT